MEVEVSVVTPEGRAFEGSAQSIVLPGAEGEFGVLSGHEVFLTALQAGALRIAKPGGETLHAAISRGFAEVHGDSVTVMVGSCEFAHEIDLDRARIARDRAQRQLEEMRATTEGEEAYQQYQEDYSRALARIAASEQSEK